MTATLKVDEIIERTPGEGVTVNGVKIPDDIGGGGGGVGLTEGGVIRGTIAMWCLAGKSETDKRTWLDERNWYICDGGGHAQEKGRADYADVPDLQGQFIKGASSHAEVGSPSGSTSTEPFTLSSSNIPNHSHSGSTNTKGSHSHTSEVSEFGSGMAAGEGIKFQDGATGTDGNHSHVVTIGNYGSGNSHTHTGVNPPNTLVDYIIYLGPRI